MMICGTARVNSLRRTIALALLAGAGCSETAPPPPLRVGFRDEEPDAPTARIINPVIELKLDEPVRTPGCFAQIVQLGSSGRRVLVISSDESSTTETVPGILLRAELPAEGGPELAGLQLKAQAFVQVTAGGPVWHTTPDQPIAVEVTAATDSDLTGKVTGGELQSSDGQTRIAVSGSFEGLLKKVSAERRP